MIRSLAFWGMLYAQQVELGTAFTRQGYLQGKDTVFSLEQPSRVLAVKYYHNQNLTEDTLWVIVRSIKGTHGRFYMLRSRLRPKEANAYILIKEPGIYLVMIYQKNLRRLALKRFYVTSPKYPNLASLVRRRNQILAQQKKTPTASKPMTAATEDELESLVENLTESEPVSPKQITLENIEEDISDFEVETEEIPLDDDEPDLIEEMDLEDTEELEDL